MKRTLYLFSSGTLSRSNNSLVFEKEGKKKIHLPVEQTSEIFAFGELNLNKRVLEFLTQQKIPLHFFNNHDYYFGTYYPREYLNSGYLTLKQSTFYTNDEKRSKLAKKIVEGSMINMLEVLKYYNRRGKKLSKFIDHLSTLKETLSKSNNIEEIMAIEGNFRNVYYKSFDSIIHNKNFEFVSRTRRPPLNRLNALISFGNSMLYITTLGEIYRTHLDPRIGILHSTNFRSFSLNLDIAEIFKPLIIDRLIFSLVNKKQLKREHFSKHLEGIYLNDKGKEIFVKNYDERLKTTLIHPNLKRKVSYKYLIRLELYKIEKHIIEEKDYVPYKG